MRTYAIRLHPGQDLKKRVIKFCNENKIQAGVILTCVGSLSKATLRLADENIKKEFVEKIPRTLISLSSVGRKAFEEYQEKMKDILGKFG